MGNYSFATMLLMLMLAMEDAAATAGADGDIVRWWNDD